MNKQNKNKKKSKKMLLLNEWVNRIILHTTRSLCTEITFFITPTQTYTNDKVSLLNFKSGKYLWQFYTPFSSAHILLNPLFRFEIWRSLMANATIRSIWIITRTIRWPRVKSTVNRNTSWSIAVAEIYTCPVNRICKVCFFCEMS